MTATDLSSAPSSTFSSQAVLAAEDAELQQFMQNLTKDMQGKFNGLLDNVLGKIEEMTGRIEDLERNVNELIVTSSQATQE